MDRKKVIATFATLMIATTLLAPLMFTSPVQAQDPLGWYHTVQGVLDTDTYELYPYWTNESLDIGFSKYGEMIDPNTGTGMNYSDRDPFANEAIPMKYWLNGWLLEVRYTHRTHHDRYILAAAMFADMADYGGDWITGKKLPFTTSPYGGRKTTAYAATEDMEVLYDGPRRFIGLCTTHIYDWEDTNNDTVVDHPTETWPVVDVLITILFNKVKKEVIVLKDVKLIIDTKILDSPVDCQFSNRGEWDLGPDPDHESYAHLWHQNLTTCYGNLSHMAPGILREFKYSIIGPDSPPRTVILPEGHLAWYGYPVVERSERVYVNNHWQVPGEDYTINYDTGYITFTYDLDSEDDIIVYYKLPKYYWEELGSWHWDDWEGIPHHFDLAQMISSDEEYVGFAAFWPTLSDYTVDGWAKVFTPLLNVSQPDMIPVDSEPDIPFLIGEWDFMLDYVDPWSPQFRGVTVYGLTDLWDADDADIENGAHSDVPDREVMYQLEEVFWPYDLASAVHKWHAREVDFFDGDDETTAFNLTYAPNYDVWDSYWTGDGVPDERVLVNGTLQVPERATPIHEETNYTYSINQAGGQWWINFTEAPPEGEDNIKVLYSTDYDRFEIPEGGLNVTGRYEWTIVGREAKSVDSVGAALVTAAFKNKAIEIGMAGLGMWDSYIPNQIPHVMRRFGTGHTAYDYHYDHDAGDHRAALRDDWCTTWPVTSSNMIGVGGPLANVYAYYVNDFTEAYYDSTDEEIETSTCWAKNTYASDEDTGYAVISTYKDINGTINLVIWGHWGRDTFYASKWFHEGGAFQLQDAPLCITGIVLEIDYTEHEPEVSVVECLGTISEFDWTHYEEEKGGLHDP